MGESCDKSKEGKNKNGKHPTTETVGDIPTDTRGGGELKTFHD